MEPGLFQLQSPREPLHLGQTGVAGCPTETQRVVGNYLLPSMITLLF